ncbi:UDP-N-acetylmuramoyl-L-alanine--D-glutamate ligase [Candidatus Saccharibacteria bacterium]|nr:UDP-N-acetylmuramoyl-L-alanine--D-glutamate ligase [Candidatus Saccharibacteria bacterium]
MKIALLGYGKEGKSTEAYFKKHYENLECDIFENFTYSEIKQKDFEKYNYVFRSPSVPPLHLPNETSVTKYFFDHCPCEIIGVTATKGKGTTCSFIKALLDAENADVYLVGNIGAPALDILDNLSKTSVVVYEMSSFQLWDLEKSPHIAVLGQLEPDHLNVHKDYEDYLNAKANITNFQSKNDYLIYYQDNPETTKIASHSKAITIPYPFAIDTEVKSAIPLPGNHNLNNALAAIAAVASHKNISPDEYLREYKTSIMAGLQSFHGLPHRLEFIRNYKNIKFYDDNFATNISSTRVAIDSFPEANITIIVGGRDKTNNADLPALYEILTAPQIKHIILLGESGHALAENFSDPRFTLADTLQDAIKLSLEKALAYQSAHQNSENIVLMSPAAASFDMFENVYDRGVQFQALVKNLR